MTTFTMQDLNNTEVTKEEEEAMQALERTREAWVNYGVQNPPQYTAEQIEKVEKTMDKKGEWAFNVGEVLPNPDVSTIINNICTQLQLLSTVINQAKAQPNTTPPEGNQSLQECVSAVLENSDWFEEKVREIVDSRVDDLFDSKDFDYEIGGAVSAWFDDFNLGDYTDIDEVVERAVEDKLSNASINVEFN